MSDEKMLRDALTQLQAMTQPPSGAEPSTTTASDSDGFVTITHGANIQVRVDRVLCPDPDTRRQLERAIAASVSDLIAQREADQRAAGDRIGEILSARMVEEMKEPTAALDEQLRGVKEQIQDRLAMIERRRSRLR